MSNIGNKAGANPSVQVWDLGVRLFHWGLVAGVAASYLSEDARSLHKTLGYIVMGLIAFRLIWGFVGTYHARFVNFVPGPGRLVRYLGDIAQHREARHLGHNPAGGAMIVALLATLGAIGTTGYMMGMKAFFGVEWVENAHEAFVNILLLLVVLHLAGVAIASVRHGANLVRAMVTGHKSPHEGDATDK